MESDSNVRRPLIELSRGLRLRWLYTTSTKYSRRISRNLPHNEISCKTTNVVFAIASLSVPSHLWADTANSPTLNASIAATHALMLLTTLNPRGQSDSIGKDVGVNDMQF